MTNQNDPIDQIKKAEKDSKDKIEQAKKQFEEKLQDFESQLSEKVEDLKESLKTSGNKKLDTVKKEAGELVKSNLSTFENEKKQLLSKAKEQKPSAIEEVVNVFISSTKK